MELLLKAYEGQKEIYGDEHIVSAPTLTLIANCYTKKGAEHYD